MNDKNKDDDKIETHRPNSKASEGDKSVAPTPREIKSSEKPSPVTSKKLVKRHSRHLPHWQFGSKVYFITFRSARGPLPESAMCLVKENILHDHGKKLDLLLATIMPDHVHMLIKPRKKGVGATLLSPDNNDEWYDLAEIMKGIKGVSARRINKLLGTRSRVWQKESFDRIVRSQKEFDAKMEYIYFNPVKAGLVSNREEYEFLIRPKKT
jgi:REP element-mobilizing transposase RayT